MRLARLSEQIRTYNWFGMTIELAIVIVGVLIAMQVANWNQDRIDRERGRQYYQRIEADLRQQIVDLRFRDAYYATLRQYGERALADFDRPAAQARRIVAQARATPELKNDLTRYLMDVRKRENLRAIALREAQSLLAQMQKQHR
jgi:hypothetical protein